jgi:hypothetical protein
MYSVEQYSGDTSTTVYQDTTTGKPMGDLRADVVKVREDGLVFGVMERVAVVV